MGHSFFYFPRLIFFLKFSKLSLFWIPFIIWYILQNVRFIVQGLITIIPSFSLLFMFFFFFLCGEKSPLYVLMSHCLSLLVFNCYHFFFPFNNFLCKIKSPKFVYYFYKIFISISLYRIELSCFQKKKKNRTRLNFLFYFLNFMRFR